MCRPEIETERWIRLCLFSCFPKRGENDRYFVTTVQNFDERLFVKTYLRSFTIIPNLWKGWKKQEKMWAFIHNQGYRII